MLTDILAIMKKHNLEGGENLDKQIIRQQRLSEQLERLISPEGTYPAVGRSIVYRFGIFHALSQMSLMKRLPEKLLGGKYVVRLLLFCIDNLQLRITLIRMDG